MLTRWVLTAAAFAALGATSLAASTPIIVNSQAATWQASPLKGTQMAPIVGNPTGAGGYYAYLLKVPAGTRVPAHFHAMRETVTVISGVMMFGIGDAIDAGKMLTLGPGNVVSVPAGLHHYAMAKTDSIIEVSGIGPDTTTFVHKM
ncbi:MAG TPA: cupin domain-containing protein [Candidatus Cybelea sp.]|nr:cupin domain-containing protein [Candidatus Cybelea sp.]